MPVPVMVDATEDGAFTITVALFTIGPFGTLVPSRRRCLEIKRAVVDCGSAGVGIGPLEDH